MIKILKRDKRKVYFGKDRCANIDLELFCNVNSKPIRVIDFFEVYHSARILKNNATMK